MHSSSKRFNCHGILVLFDLYWSLFIDKSKCDATFDDDHCCTADKPCGVGEGDCDSDDQCSGDLKCGTDNCGTGFVDVAMDCCQAEPGNINKLDFLTKIS